MYQSFGQTDVSAPLPFYAQPDPAAALILGIQTLLGTDPTGVWDRATHEAMAREIRANGGTMPEWGTPGINVDLWVRPDPTKTGPLAPREALAAQALGLPTDTWENLNAELAAHNDEIMATVAEANRRVDAAERTAVTTVAAASSAKWWILGGVVAAAVLVGAVVISSKKEG